MAPLGTGGVVMEVAATPLQSVRSAGSGTGGPCSWLPTSSPPPLHVPPLLRSCLCQRYGAERATTLLGAGTGPSWVAGGWWW